MSRAAALACLALVFCAPTRADLIVGHANLFDGSSAPFSGQYTGEYQQVYAAAAFATAPIQTITALSFGTVPFGNIGDPIPQTITFTLSLSTTSAGPQTLSTDFAANRGADFTQVFSGTLTYTPSRSLTVDLTIPTSTFVYDSSMGNLLMDINVSSGAGYIGAPPPPAVDNFFAVDTSGSVMGRVFLERPFGPGGPANPTVDGIGLVTEFGSSPGSIIAPVPEPGSLVLVAVGLGALVVVRRRPTATVMVSDGLSAD